MCLHFTDSSESSLWLELRCPKRFFDVSFISTVIADVATKLTKQAVLFKTLCADGLLMMSEGIERFWS